MNQKQASALETRLYGVSEENYSTILSKKLIKLFFLVNTLFFFVVCSGLFTACGNDTICDNDTATKIAIIDISLDKSVLTLDVGSTEILTAIVNPIDEMDNAVLHWTSSDEAKAIVDNNGRVTGIAAGNVKITVTTDTGGNTAECNVTVNSVYITGFFLYGNPSRYRPCYWKDGTRIDLPGGISDGSTRGIAVSNGKTYVSGVYSDISSGNGTTNKACYWLNGVRIDLPDETGNSAATGISVSGNKIYISGWYNNGNFIKACYWIDGVKNDLPVEYGNSLATDIVVLDGKVYIAGGYGKFNAVGNNITSEISEFIYCYWINGERIDLSGQSTKPASCKIAVSDGKIYIKGYLTEQSSHTDYRIYSFGYWIDGERIENGRSLDSNIIVSNNKVYAAGDFWLNYEGGGSRRQACYWIDDVRIDLPSDTYSSATAIAVSGDKIYVAGEYQGGICYWVDGIRTDLPNGFQSTSIIVVNE